MEFLIVDNSGECTPEADDVSVIDGDNSVREFSGWAKGLAEREPVKDEVIVFVNDTFAVNYGSRFLRWFGSSEVMRALVKGFAVGYVDSRPDEVEVCGYRIQSWLRTSIFMLRSEDLWKVLPLVPKVDFSKLFARAGDDLFASDAPISSNLRWSLNRWLVRKPVPKGEYDGGVWHSSSQLTDENRHFMQMKAQCIVCELLLSAHLHERGVRFFNVRTSWRRAFGLFAIADRVGILSWLRLLRYNWPTKRF